MFIDSYYTGFYWCRTLFWLFFLTFWNLDPEPFLPLRWTCPLSHMAVKSRRGDDLCMFFKGLRRKRNLLFDTPLPLHSCQIQLAPDAALKQRPLLCIWPSRVYSALATITPAHTETDLPRWSYRGSAASAVRVLVCWQRRMERTKQLYGVWGGWNQKQAAEHSRMRVRWRPGNSQ